MRLLFSDGADKFDKQDDGQDYTLVPKFAPTKEEADAKIAEQKMRDAIEKEAEVYALYPQANWLPHRVHAVYAHAIGSRTGYMLSTLKGGGGEPHPQANWLPHRVYAVYAHAIGPRTGCMLSTLKGGGDEPHPQANLLPRR
eukprot:6774547-Pyramimonas_sp.AAC.1